MIRDRQILISYDLLAQLRACAKLDGAGNAENVLEAIVIKAMDARPEVADLIKMEQAAKKQAHTEWLAKWKLTDPDQLP